MESIIHIHLLGKQIFLWPKICIGYTVKYQGGGAVDDKGTLQPWYDINIFPTASRLSKRK